MSHRKRLEQQFSSSKKGKREIQDVDDYNHIENIDYSERTDAQLDNLVDDVKDKAGTAAGQRFKGLDLDRDLNLDGDENEKYQGKPVSRQQLLTSASKRVKKGKEDESSYEDEENYIDEEEEDEDIASDEYESAEDLPAVKGKSSASISNSKKKPKLASKKVIEDFNIDDIIEDLDRQDDEVFKDVQRDKKELAKAGQVRNQQKLWDGLVENRVAMQGIFKLANQLPQGEDLEHYKKQEPKAKLLLADLQVELMDLLDLAEDVSEELQAKSSITKGTSSAGSIASKRRLKQAQKYLQKIKINRDTFMNDYEFDTDALWNDLDTHFLSVHPKLEETISTFAQRFNLINTNSLKGRFLNIFQTPVQQAQKVMDDYPRLIKRSQLRDKDMEIMGQLDEEKRGEYDEEIYNDTEFYLQLYKEMMASSNTKTDAEEEGLLLGNTQAYLKERMLRSKAARPDVDRRASKARKLRYDVHMKLLNFMTPIENIRILPGRDEMIKNLFGVRNSNLHDVETNHETDEQKSTSKIQLRKKQKSTKKRSKVQTEPEEDEEEIRLF